MLTGTAIATELIEAGDRSPFSISHPIKPDEFGREEARALQQGLQAHWPGQAENIFDRIFYWTGGHPYLTQRLCLSVVESSEAGIWSDAEMEIDEWVDRLVEKQFLATAVNEDPNLNFVREQVEQSPHPRRLLTIYRQVYRGKKVRDRQSIELNKLKLLGLVRSANGALTVRNRVYRQAFNLDWVKEGTSLHINWARYLIGITALLALFLFVDVGLSLYRQRQEMIANHGQDIVSRFRTQPVPMSAW